MCDERNDLSISTSLVVCVFDLRVEQQLIAVALGRFAPPPLRCPDCRGRRTASSITAHTTRQTGSATAGAAALRQVPIRAARPSPTSCLTSWRSVALVDAMDIGLHPDSAEGQALMEYLRANGIPFLAFRSAIPGKSTGPHIHIGLPSRKIISSWA